MTLLIVILVFGGMVFLHELGHYLGLDEDDLFERGLD